ncbi:MAG: hypothetical protein ACRDWI_12590 [Jiangellaceae bacterium]
MSRGQVDRCCAGGGDQNRREGRRWRRPEGDQSNTREYDEPLPARRAVVAR